MATRFKGHSQSRQHMALVTLAKGAGWGLIAGFVGTLVMDLILMEALSITGRSAFTCFSIIGDTTARFFSKLGAEITGGIPTGVAAHYLVGPVVGAIFGAAVARIDAFRINTLRKGIVLAVLYVEILSQPILAATPLLLKMTAFETFKWFGGSFVMHLIWGVVAGAIVSYGLGLENECNQEIAESTAFVVRLSEKSPNTHGT